MDPKTYTLGEAIILSAELYDAGDNLADAGNIRLLVLPPNAAGSTIVSLTSAGVGKVSGAYTPSGPGTYRYRFETTAGIGAAAEGEFMVAARQVPPPM